MKRKTKNEKWYRWIWETELTVIMANVNISINEWGFKIKTKYRCKNKKGRI